MMDRVGDLGDRADTFRVTLDQPEDVPGGYQSEYAEKGRYESGGSHGVPLKRV